MARHYRIYPHVARLPRTFSFAFTPVEYLFPPLLCCSVPDLFINYKARGYKSEALNFGRNLIYFYDSITRVSMLDEHSRHAHRR